MKHDFPIRSTMWHRYPRPHRMGNLSGFTLLEAMLAVFIFSLLMVAVGSVWTVSWKALMKIEEGSYSDNSADYVLRRLSEAVEASVFHTKPGTLYVWKGEKGLSSDSHRLSFVTSLAPDVGEAYLEFSPLERIQIEVRSEGGKQQLIMSAAPFTMEEDDWQRETVLMEDVDSFQVRFWDKVRKDWVDEWKNGAAAPEAVQMSIKIKGESDSSDEPSHTRTVQVPSQQKLEPLITSSGSGTGSTNSPPPAAAPTPKT